MCVVLNISFHSRYICVESLRFYRSIMTPGHSIESYFFAWSMQTLQKVCSCNLNQKKSVQTKSFKFCPPSMCLLRYLLHFTIPTVWWSSPSKARSKAVFPHPLSPTIRVNFPGIYRHRWLEIYSTYILKLPTTCIAVSQVGTANRSALQQPRTYDWLFLSRAVHQMSMATDRKAGLGFRDCNVTCIRMVLVSWYGVTKAYHVQHI